MRGILVLGLLNFIKFTNNLTCGGNLMLIHHYYIMIDFFMGYKGSFREFLDFMCR